MPCIDKQTLAEQDLVKIWLYTFQEWGERQADRYLDDLDETIHLLAEQPLLCRESEIDIPNHSISPAALSDCIKEAKVHEVETLLNRGLTGLRSPHGYGRRRQGVRQLVDARS